ncbi:MAG: hypothetical protein LQ349_005333 [Xanthoria aureola]|nr:MAG: hypothetical protein LQ349_005333 [Xanthoria aureola]
MVDRALVAAWIVASFVIPGGPGPGRGLARANSDVNAGIGLKIEAADIHQLRISLTSRLFVIEQTVQYTPLSRNHSEATFCLDGSVHHFYWVALDKSLSNLAVSDIHCVVTTWGEGWSAAEGQGLSIEHFKMGTMIVWGVVSTITPIATRDLIDGVFDDSQHGSDTQDAPGAVHQETKYSKRNVLLEVPKAPCRIFDYIKYQVDTNPDAPALQYESDPAISYAQLDKLTERIARALSVRKGTIVPICMDVSVNLIATIVAILRAGAVYLVLDPKGSVERNNGVIEDCNANIAIIDTHYAPSYERKKHDIEEASVTDAAYLVYTSGATGTPKGVVVTHSAASHGIAHFSLGERTRWLLFYNPIFSAAQRTILATLSKGACVCLASRDKLATSLFEIVQETQIDALGLTPSALALLSASEVPACLKQITTVGEPLSQEVVNEWSDKVELRVSYGLSECAQLNFATKLHKGDNARRLEAPKDTTNAFILQPHTTKRVEAGRQGELCLEGPQIAAGYYHREEQTDAAFIDNTFGSGKLYRTGDLAIRHHDGSFEVLGRIDSQIKVHGQRLEPAEVSAALSKHVGIRSLAVLGATIKGRMSLVAAIIPGNGFEWTTLVQDLRETAQRSLAPYMSKAPLNDGEIAIRDAWASALSLDPKLIQKANSFNTFGGTSMDAIGVVRELRGRGWKVELGAMLKAGRLSDVDVQPLDPETQPGTHATPRHALIGDKIVQDELSRDRAIVDAYPLTQLQGSLFASTLDGNLDYLYQRVYDVRHLDLVKLKLAFEAVFKSKEDASDHLPIF